MISLAEQLRARRQARKHSQADLAATLGKSRSWVASIERGEFRPKAQEVAILANYLGAMMSDTLSAAGYTPHEIALLGLERVALTRAEIEAIAFQAATVAVQLFQAAHPSKPDGETRLPNPGFGGLAQGLIDGHGQGDGQVDPAA